MAYTSNSEFDAETRVQKTNEIRPLDIYEGVHSILKRDIWKWLLGWSDTTTDLNYDLERKDDPNYNYMDDSYPAKIVNGTPAPEYGEKLVKQVWNPNRTDELGNPLDPAYEEVPATNQTRLEIDGTILPEHDLFLHEIYRYLSNLYPDHPDWVELLTHNEIVDAFENAAAMVDYKPDDKFFILVAQNLEGVKNLDKEDDEKYYEVRKEELKLLLRNLTSNSYRRKFYGASDGYKMFGAGVGELTSCFPVGEYLPLHPGCTNCENTIKNCKIDIFDPNFKKAFRIIDWNGKSRDLPQDTSKDLEVEGYATPGNNKTIIEIHDLDDEDPELTSAASIFNVRTYFKVPFTSKGITYFKSLDDKETKVYAKLDEALDGTVAKVSTSIPTIKFNTTQALPLPYATLYNYGTFKDQYDISENKNLAPENNNIASTWGNIQSEEAKTAFENQVYNTATPSALPIINATLKQETPKAVPFTIDPASNGIILQPHETIKIYEDTPEYEFEVNKGWKILPSYIDDPKNKYMETFPFKKGEILSSDVITGKTPRFSLYNFVGNNRGKLKISLKNAYNEKDPIPNDFGEFSSHLLETDFISERYVYGLLIQLDNIDLPVFISGKIQPTWDVSTMYIQPTSLVFYPEYIPNEKSPELLEFLYGNNYRSIYSPEEIEILKKNRELFYYEVNPLGKQLDEVFKNVSFNTFATENVNLMPLVNSFENFEEGSFLVYQHYIHEMLKAFEENGRELPSRFTFKEYDKILAVDCEINKTVVSLDTHELIRSQVNYSLKYNDITAKTIIEEEFTFNNMSALAYEDFTFGKGSKVLKVLKMFKEEFAESAEEARLCYEVAPGIPNEGNIEIFDLGHANIIEYLTNFNESSIIYYTFRKQSQTSEDDKNDKLPLYNGYNEFKITVKEKNTKNTYRVGIVSPKPELSTELYNVESNNDQKLNIIGERLWYNFKERVAGESHKYLAVSSVLVPLEILATRETDTNDDLAMRTLTFSGEEAVRMFETLTVGDTVEGNGLPYGTYIVQKGKNEVILNNSIPKVGTLVYKFNCSCEAYPQDIGEDFMSYKRHLRSEKSLVSSSPFDNGLWGSNEWPHVSQAYINGLVDPQDFSPINPQDTAKVIYDHKIKDRRTQLIQLSSISVGTKMYYELNCRKLINLANRLGNTENLMNVEWLDYFDSNLNNISQASEATNVGVNLMMQTDTSGYFTRRDKALYTDDDLKLKFQTFAYDNDNTIPCYIQIGTGGTAYQKYFKSPSLVEKPTTYGAAFYDHPIHDIKIQQKNLEEAGGNWKKRFVYSIGDISKVSTGSGLFQIDKPLFEVPLGEYDVQKRVRFDKEKGVKTGPTPTLELDTVSASFQKQTYKNLTRTLKDDEIQILNKDYIEYKLISDDDAKDANWVNMGEWKPSIIRAEDNTTVVNYPDPKKDLGGNIEKGVSYCYSIFSNFSDYISNKAGRTLVSFPATSILVCEYPKGENGPVTRKLQTIGFGGVTWETALKETGTNSAYLKKSITTKNEGTQDKYIPIYVPVVDPRLDTFKTFSVLAYEEGTTFKSGELSLVFENYGRVCTNIVEGKSKTTYIYNINNSAFKLYENNDYSRKNPIRTYTYKFTAGSPHTLVLTNTYNSEELTFTSESHFPANKELEALTEVVHAGYIQGFTSSEEFEIEALTKTNKKLKAKYLGNGTLSEEPNTPGSIIVIGIVRKKDDSSKPEDPEENWPIYIDYKVLVYNRETFEENTEGAYIDSFTLPKIIPLYEGLFVSSVNFDSLGHPEELSFFDGTFGSMYVSYEELLPGTEVINLLYQAASLESGLRVIQDHQNTLKLPRSYVADGSYNIQLQLDPHFISKGYRYMLVDPQAASAAEGTPISEATSEEDRKNKIEEIDKSTSVSFNVSQSKIFYDDIHKSFYTFADLYTDKNGQWVKDENNLKQKIAISFREQKFFKDTTKLTADYTKVLTQKEGSNAPTENYVLKPTSGVTFNTAKYSSSDRVLNITETALRSEKKPSLEPTLFSAYQEIKGELVGVTKDHNFVVGAIGKQENNETALNTEIEKLAPTTLEVTDEVLKRLLDGKENPTREDILKECKTQEEKDKVNIYFDTISQIDTLDGLSKTLYKSKLKKPFEGQSISSPNAVESPLFKYYKNCLIFEGAIDTTNPDKIVAPKDDEGYFKKVFEMISEGDILKSSTPLSKGTTLSRVSVTVSDDDPDKKLSPYVKTLKIKYEKSNLVLAGVDSNGIMGIFCKKTPLPVSNLSIKDFKYFKFDTQDKNATIEDIVLNENNEWTLTLKDAKASTVSVNPFLEGNPIPVFEKTQTADARHLLEGNTEFLMYDNKTGQFDYFQAKDISIRDGSELPLSDVDHGVGGRYLWYNSSDGNYDRETTQFYIGPEMLPPQKTELAKKGHSSLQWKEKIGTNLWKIEESWLRLNHNIDNAPFPSEVEVSTDTGGKSKTSNVQRLYISDTLSKNKYEVYIDGNNLFIKTPNIKSTSTILDDNEKEKYKPSKAYWINAEIPSVRNTLEERLNAVSIDQFKNRKSPNSEATQYGILVNAWRETIDAYNNSLNIAKNTWKSLPESVKEGYKTEENYLKAVLSQQYSEYEFYLYNTLAVEKRFGDQIVDLTAFEKSAKQQGDKWVVTYNTPFNPGIQAIDTGSYEFREVVEDEGQLPLAYRKYCLLWLQHILPAVDDTIAGENFLCSENVQSAMINVLDTSTDLILLLKNGQVLKTNLDLLDSPEEIKDSKNWSSYALPAETFYMAKNTTGTAYVERSAHIDGKTKTYSVASRMYLKTSYNVTNTYKFGTTLLFSGYFDSKATIRSEALEPSAANTINDKYVSENKTVPAIIYAEPGSSQLKVFETKALIDNAVEDETVSLENGPKYSLKQSSITVGSLAAFNKELVVVLSPKDDTQLYFKKKFSVTKSKSENPSEPGKINIELKEVPKTDNIGGADQITVNSNNMIMYWQEPAKGIINNDSIEFNGYVFDYLYYGAIGLNISEASLSQGSGAQEFIQLSQGLSVPEGTEPATYNYLFSVLTTKAITNPYEYYKLKNSYIDFDSGLVKVSPTQIDATLASADKVYIAHECISKDEPYEESEGWPALEEDTDKVFYNYDTKGQVIPLTNGNGDPVYLCDESGNYLSSMYPTKNSRIEGWNIEGIGVYDFANPPKDLGTEEPLQDVYFRKAAQISIKDAASSSQKFSFMLEDKTLESLLFKDTLKIKDFQFGDDNKKYAQIVITSENTSILNELKDYLCEINDEELFNRYYKETEEKGQNAGMQLLNTEKDLASKEEDPEIKEAMISTISLIENLNSHIISQDGEWGGEKNQFKNFSERFQSEKFGSKSYIYDKKYECYSLKNIRYLDTLVKVMSHKPWSKKIGEGIQLTYTEKSEGVEEFTPQVNTLINSKFPVTGIYYPLKGYGGLTHTIYEWSEDHLPWTSLKNDNDPEAFEEKTFSNIANDDIIITASTGFGLIKDSKVIESQKPMYKSFDELVTKKTRLLSKGQKIVKSKNRDIMNFAAVNPKLILLRDPIEEIPIEVGQTKQITIEVLSVADTSDFTKDINEDVVEVSKDELDKYPPNRVYFDPEGIPAPPVVGSKITQTLKLKNTKQLKAIKTKFATNIYNSKNNYAFYQSHYTNKNNIPIFQCDENGKYIKYSYNTEGLEDRDIDEISFEESRVLKVPLSEEEAKAGYSSGILFNPTTPLYNTCEEWFMNEFYLRGHESNPFWQVVQVYPKFNTNTMRFDSKSKIFEFTKASGDMVLKEVDADKTYISMRKTSLRKTEGIKTTITPNASYIDLLPGEIYFILSQPENLEFRDTPSFVKFGISYLNSFYHGSKEEDTEKVTPGIHGEIWDSRRIINLPSELDISYTINTSEDFANPDNKDAGIVHISEFGIFDKNHELIAYATFPPIEYRSDTQHISFTCFLNHNPLQDYHAANKKHKN